MSDPIYLVVFTEGDVHRMNECPSENNLKATDATYIKITNKGDEIELESYSNLINSWVKITL